MNAEPIAGSPVTDSGFSPVDNELPLRWMRRLHLVPANRLGTFRRALFFAAVSWLPIAAWAVLAGRPLNLSTDESLLGHYGVHVRCLLAVPLFILAEASLDGTVKRMAAHFLSTGIVPRPQSGAFERTIADARSFRDSSLPWVFMLGALLAWVAFDPPADHDDALAWAHSADGTLAFGGWWFVYVSRPIFIGLLLGWLWRILLMGYWFWRIGRLDLSLVPSHPDRAGGMAFVEKLPGAFMLVTLAVSAVVTSHWAHEIAYHSATLQSFKVPAALLVILWTLLVLLPLFALAPPLAAARKQAILQYGELVGEQGRLVHRRWILHEKVGDAPVLDAPEIGPVADAAAMYDAVKRMRKLPIGKSSLIRIVVPLALPMLVIAAMQVPVGELFLKLAKALL